MNPAWLFPLLALCFAAAAAWSGLRRGQWQGAPRTWLLLAALFGAVGLWLNL